jgi:hypothetical protein
MNRREFVSIAALTGLVAAPAGSRALSPRRQERLQCRCTRLDDASGAEDDRDAPAGFRLDLLGPADDGRGARPGFGLKAVYSGLFGGHEFVMIHPADGDISRAGSLHFARRSLAGLEVQWSDRRVFMPTSELFGHRREPGHYRLDVREPGGERLALALRVVAA